MCGRNEETFPRIKILLRIKELLGALDDIGEIERLLEAREVTQVLEVFRKRADDDHRNIFQLFVLVPELDEALAIHERHAEIADDEFRGWDDRKELNGIVPIGDRENVEPRGFVDLSQGHAHIVIIFDNENGFEVVQHTCQKQFYPRTRFHSTQENLNIPVNR